MSKPKLPKLPWLKMVVYLPFALVNIAGGLAMFATGIPFLFPIGIFLLIMSAVPYANWLSKKINADVAYAERDHALLEGEEKPWESEGLVRLSEDEMLDIILNSNGRGSIQ